MFTLLGAVVVCVKAAPHAFVAAPVVTATSSQYVARNYNGVADYAYTFAAPYVAAPYETAPYIAAPAAAAVDPLFYVWIHLSAM